MLFQRQPGVVRLFLLGVLGVVTGQSTQQAGISLNPADAFVQTVGGQIFGPG